MPRSRTPPPPESPQELHQKLAGLDRLRQAGLITEAMYRDRYERVAARLAAAPPDPTPGVSAPVNAPAPLRFAPVAIGVSPPPAPPVSGADGMPGAAGMPGDPLPPAERGPRGRPDRTKIAIALVSIVGILVIGGIGATRVVHRGATSAASAATARAEPATVQDFLPTAKAFVARARGLDFLHDVPVTFLTDAAFEAKFLAGSPTQSIDKQAISDEEKVLKATHLIDPSVNLAALVQQSGAAGIEGFYDVRAKALFVRGTKPTPYVREVLVHELTHAVQDQHFGLDRQLPPSRSGEAGRGFQALAEGDASRIQHAYRASESAADQVRAQDVDRGTPAEQAAAAQIPQVFHEFGSFPYTSGEQFVNAVAASGGNTAVDQAFQQPPSTSAQILDPARYLTGGGYGKFSIPPAPVAPFDGGVWGALGYKVIFDHLVQTGGLSAAAAAAGARAWGADFWLAWDQGGHTCWRDDIAAAGGTSAPALVAALSAYVASGHGAITVAGRLTGAGPFQITACT